LKKNDKLEDLPDNVSNDEEFKL